MAKKKTPDATGPAPTARPATRRRAPAAKRAVAEERVGGAPASPDPAAAEAPTFDQIAEAAYHRYLSRGGGHGQDFDDWLKAEQDLRSGKS